MSSPQLEHRAFLLSDLHDSCDVSFPISVLANVICCGGVCMLVEIEGRLAVHVTA